MKPFEIAISQAKQAIRERLESGDYNITKIENMTSTLDVSGYELQVWSGMGEKHFELYYLDCDIFFKGLFENASQKRKAWKVYKEKHDEFIQKDKDVRIAELKKQINQLENQ